MPRIPATITTFHSSKEGKSQAVKTLRALFSGFKKQPVYTLVEDTIPEKKYMHVPTEAAAGFLRTATPFHLKVANEIL